MKPILYNNINLAEVYRIAVEAGQAILEVYESPFAVEKKEDKSPLTEADKRSNTVIQKGLQELTPGIPQLSEESKMVDYSVRKNWNHFWMIDPLDGTKEFIKRNGEFTVNIALIEQGNPVAGIVYVPATGVGYLAVVGEGAWRIDGGQMIQLLAGNTASSNTIRVVASRSHLSAETEDFVSSLKQQGKEIEFISKGSSLKLCMIAEGSADVYPRFAPTMEWDTAAAHAVVKAAGKDVVQFPEKVPLVYNKENLLNPWFIAQ